MHARAYDRRKENEKGSEGDIEKEHTENSSYCDEIIGAMAFLVLHLDVRSMQDEQ